MSRLQRGMGAGMKRYVVIGYDNRGHYVIGKVFEDIDTAKEYYRYLDHELTGKLIGEELRSLDYIELYEMDYVPSKP
ncbi:hypothetical protein RGU12_08090 [Fredinandcohnia sp. QZ13]|uniref:hypothetical protein n=1 Tax=Fredinandcohnia sp. QZ13 TaxID=3073144 RepID=UPI00285356E5|nr:hypothetical protein [Fredinandcohnia sp. QZ13]MDR4887521.1 hypothetical protein [Fredinandcohnia sp. QZ13]